MNGTDTQRTRSVVCRGATAPVRSRVNEARGTARACTDKFGGRHIAALCGSGRVRRMELASLKRAREAGEVIRRREKLWTFLHHKCLP